MRRETRRSPERETPGELPERETPHRRSSRETPHRLSVVVPLYNEEAAIEPLVDRIIDVARPLTEELEVVLVDDGSRDATTARAAELAQRTIEVRFLELSRNYGKEIALTAGLDHATGDVVVLLDGDLQHPPEAIPAFLEKWREGYEVVYGVRRSRHDESLLLRKLKSAFYRTFNRLADTPLPPEAGDFRLLDRQAADALRSYRERARFMKGLYVDIGFRTAAVEFDVGERVGGRSSWSLWSLWKFAVTGLTAHTTLALRIWGYLGFFVAVAALGYGAWITLRTLIYGIDVPGYASTIVLILFFGSLQMISMGVLGEYLARVHEEVKDRPLYIVRRAVESEDGPA